MHAIDRRPRPPARTRALPGSTMPVSAQKLSAPMLSALLLSAMLLSTLLPWVLPSRAHAADAAPAMPSTIRLVVPFPAGGATDIVARGYAKAIAKTLNVSVVVDNKPGAGGAIGAADAARAKPDGQTLLLTTSSTHSVGPHLVKQRSYDVDRDFTPIAQLATAASVLVVNGDVPAKDVQELISLAKQKPGSLNYGSSGNGTVVHLTTEAFRDRAGIDLVHVPYKGTGAAMTDLVAGQVQIVFDSIPSAQSFLKDGRVRAIAVTGLKRSPLMPQVPTLDESGLKGYESVTWFGLYGPAGLDPSLAKRFAKASDDALASPELQQHFERNGIDAVTGVHGEDFARVVKADSERWGRLIRDRGITAN